MMSVNFVLRNGRGIFKNLNADEQAVEVMQYRRTKLHVITAYQHYLLFALDNISKFSSANQRSPKYVNSIQVV